MADKVQTGHLSTLGYASPGSLEALERLMLDPDTRLFDIRYSPHSRLFQWRGEVLEAKYGHRYQHVRSLGNVAYKNKGKEPIKLANPDAGIPYLISYLEAGYNLIILCACKHYEHCHRKVVYELVRKHMTTSELIDQYRTTASNLDKQPDALSRLLATDYRFIAELLVVALNRGSVSQLIGDLRRNLNRRVTYPYCQERNVVLQEVADTLERVETEKTDQSKESEDKP